jgi:putative acetyltransferase
VTPPEHAYILGVDHLVSDDVTFYSAREAIGGALLGVAAIRQLTPDHGEMKSMHTRSEARGQGVGTAMVAYVLDVARERCYRRLSLETGTMDDYAAARRLYATAGFRVCEPFGSYEPSPYNSFMTMDLDDWSA